MYSDFIEWLLLLGRWLHITAGITWIGTSFFFMWLDRSIEFNEQNKKTGHLGELWMVHGGGFYRVEKMLMGPTEVPKVLHWFKWESYWTWLSGFFLLAMIFYGGSGTFLIDSSVSSISYGQALALSLASLFVSWIFYDLLWESSFTKTKPLIGHALTLVWFGGMAYFLCHTLSGRAAYLHLGGMLGTWMTANVFLRIIPRQVKMVEAAKKGESVNQDWAKNAKNRSTHNTYFTLPVIFVMLSNHFPSTYGNRYNWIILLLISAAGAAIREFFITRLKNPPRSKVFAALGFALILLSIFLTKTDSGSNASPVQENAEPPAESQVIATGPTGSLNGVVSFVGTSPEKEKLKLPLVCSPESQGIVYSNQLLITNNRIQYALVRITEGLAGKIFSGTPTETALLDQKNCQYDPPLLAVRVGQKVDIVNSDPTFHNVKLVSQQNEDFNLPMPSKDDRITRIFTHSEIFAQTKCSVHPWMSASIAILDHPFYAVTDATGAYQISNIPVGNYTIEIWHTVLGKQSKKISIQENQTLELDFSLKGTK